MLPPPSAAPAPLLASASQTFPKQVSNELKNFEVSSVCELDQVYVNGKSINTRTGTTDLVRRGGQIAYSLSNRVSLYR